MTFQRISHTGRFIGLPEIVGAYISIAACVLRGEHFEEEWTVSRGDLKLGIHRIQCWLGQAGSKPEDKLHIYIKQEGWLVQEQLSLCHE